MRNLLARGAHSLFTNDLPGQKALGLIGELVLRKIRLALREMRDESFQRDLDAVAGERRNRNQLQEDIFLGTGFEQRQQRGLLYAVDLIQQQKDGAVELARAVESHPVAARHALRWRRS